MDFANIQSSGHQSNATSENDVEGFGLAVAENWDSMTMILGDDAAETASSWGSFTGLEASVLLLTASGMQRLPEAASGKGDLRLDHVKTLDHMIDHPWTPTHDTSPELTGKHLEQRLDGPSSHAYGSMGHVVVSNVDSAGQSLPDDWTLRLSTDSLGSMPSLGSTYDNGLGDDWDIEQSHTHMAADLGQSNLPGHVVADDRSATINPAVLTDLYTPHEQVTGNVLTNSPTLPQPNTNTQVPAFLCYDKDSIPAGQQPGRVLKCAWPGSSCTYISGRGRPFEMQRHMDTVHLKARSVCRRCHRSFCREEKMLSHLRTAHASTATRH